jgi:hypothetical protein
MASHHGGLFDQVVQIFRRAKLYISGQFTVSLHLAHSTL